jgi:prepilin-type N-terminal cleavage/methylation domain-containing protein
LAPGHPGSFPRCGLTLLELLLVMAIMGVVFGLGLGAFAALDPPDSSSLGLVRSTLRAASNEALSRETEAHVRFVRETDPGGVEAGSMLASKLFVAGTWNFESEALTGAFGIDGDGLALRIVDDGFIGRALSLSQKGAEARFAVQKDPAFDPGEGFVVELCLRPQPVGSSEGHVLNIGSSLGIDLLPDGSLRGWIAPNYAEGLVRDQRGARGSSFLFAESSPNSVRPGKWSRVRLEYDRRRLAIDVDGRPYERIPVDLPVRELAGPMVLSSAERQGFRGDVDKLVVSLFQFSEPIELPRGVTFTAATPREVVFGGGGGLDSAVHRGPVEIGLRFADTEGSHVTRVHVNLFGTVE